MVMPGGCFFQALPSLDLGTTPADILSQTVVSFQADGRRHGPTTLLPNSVLSVWWDYSGSCAPWSAGCIAQSLHAA